MFFMLLLLFFLVSGVSRVYISRDSVFFFFFFRGVTKVLSCCLIGEG